MVLWSSGIASGPIPTDYNKDQKVTLADFSALASSWGPASRIGELVQLGFYWLVGTSDAPDIDIQTAYTGKSRYLPGQQVEITVICRNNSNTAYQGTLLLNITCHGRSVHTDRQVISIDSASSTAGSFLWPAAQEDFQGYLVEARLSHGACATTAIDVSSDWKRYPRYGYVTEFYSSTSPARSTQILDELSRDYHINCLQYYDWMWRHENVIERDLSGQIAPEWSDWRGATISFNILQDSIAKAHDRAMAPLPYFQVYLGLDDYESVSGVSPQWGLYSNTSRSTQYFHDAGIQFWVFNPSDTAWQNHLFGEYEDALLSLDWAGIHLDQLGDIGQGNYFDYDGSAVNLEAALGGILNNSKSHLEALALGHPTLQNRDVLIFNIVNGGRGFWGVDEALDSRVDVVYSELWDNHTYGGVSDFVRYAKNRSGGKAVVLAAYMNRGEDTGGFFDADSVLLANAAFAASGAFHLELGDGEHMLAQEFFPARDKITSEDLRVRLRQHYHFITAYERLLFSPDQRMGDGGLQWISTEGYHLSGNGSADTLWFLNRGTSEHEIFHLINLLGNDDQWRNIADRPVLLHDVPVKLRLGPDAEVTQVAVASPDTAGGMMQSVPYVTGTDTRGDFLSLTLPRLEYWSMICVERTITAAANNRYEAETAVRYQVAVDTDHGGYSGSGFVDEFAETGDSVGYYVVVNQPGEYSLRFRYANGGSDASRSLIINGDFQVNMPFGSIGSWEGWNIAGTSVYLQTGVHQVILYYGSWNSGAINLDYLEF